MCRLRFAKKGPTFSCENGKGHIYQVVKSGSLSSATYCIFEGVHLFTGVNFCGQPTLSKFLLCLLFTILDFCSMDAQIAHLQYNIYI